MKVKKNDRLFTSEEQLGYDMGKLIGAFSREAKFTNMTTYKNLVRVCNEQFVDADGKAELNPNPGGKIQVHPSDPEAEIGRRQRRLALPQTRFNWLPA